MSYEYFLQAHLNQGFQPVSTERILEIFRQHITKQDDTYIDVEFDKDNSCTIFMNTVDATIDSLMVSRPCEDQQLGECLYEVMLLGNFVFYEPDGKQIITVNEATAAHIPSDMIEVLGQPAVANDKESFLELYFNNR